MDSIGVEIIHKEIRVNLCYFVAKNHTQISVGKASHKLTQIFHKLFFDEWEPQSLILWSPLFKNHVDEGRHVGYVYFAVAVDVAHIVVE